MGSGLAHHRFPNFRLRAAIPALNERPTPPTAPQFVSEVSNRFDQLWCHRLDWLADTCHVERLVIQVAAEKQELPDLDANGIGRMAGSHLDGGGRVGDLS